ncbi:FAD-dependent oxidoreductase [Amycolatopsis sp. NPDC058986]|uniref:FAD-dependent oxidoreductase n=1 Tax=unclassified Amycolatopsis TaxID=2618356 RepID=UPI00366CEC65
MRELSLGNTDLQGNPDLRWDADVVIVGGSVAGAVTAHALAEYGLTSILLERAVEFPELNRGDTIQPLSLGFLDRWGVLPEIEGLSGYPVSGSGFFHRKHGFLGSWDFEGLPGPFQHQIILRHTNFHRALYAAFAAKPDLVRVCRGAQANTVLVDGDDVVGIGGSIAGQRFHARGKLVVAADGAQSKLARFLGIEVEEPYLYEHEYLMLSCPRPRVPELEHRSMRYVGKDGLTMLIPLDGGEQVRIPFQIESADAGHWRSLPPEKLRDRLLERAPILEPVATPDVITDGTHSYRIHLRHAKSYVRHRVCLVGDAAHVVPPTVGQGMNMAMLDAEVLAAVVKRCVDVEGVSDASLGRYEQARRPVNVAALAASHEQTLRQAATGPEIDEHCVADHAWLADPDRRREIALRVAGMLNPTSRDLDFEVAS